MSPPRSRGWGPKNSAHPVTSLCDDAKAGSTKIRRQPVTTASYMADLRIRDLDRSAGETREVGEEFISRSGRTISSHAFHPRSVDSDSSRDVEGDRIRTIFLALNLNTGHIPMDTPGEDVRVEQSARSTIRLDVFRSSGGNAIYPHLVRRRLPFQNDAHPPIAPIEIGAKLAGRKGACRWFVEKVRLVLPLPLDDCDMRSRCEHRISGHADRTYDRADDQRRSHTDERTPHNEPRQQIDCHDRKPFLIPADCRKQARTIRSSRDRFEKASTRFEPEPIVDASCVTGVDYPETAVFFVAE